MIVKNARALCKFFDLHSFQGTVSPHVRHVETLPARGIYGLRIFGFRSKSRTCGACRVWIILTTAWKERTCKSQHGYSPCGIHGWQSLHVQPTSSIRAFANANLLSSSFISGKLEEVPHTPLNPFIVSQIFRSLTTRRKNSVENSRLNPRELF